MTSPYRNEINALHERKAALEQEVAQVDGLIQESQRRAKRMLDVIQVASPCSANWDEMLGGDRVRFCVTCEKNVYNLSAMPREEAEQFVQANATGEACVRFYQRADGTVMTADCPVGQRRKRRKKLAITVAGAGALALGATAMFVRQETRPLMGAMQAPPQQAAFDDVPFVVPPVQPASTVPSAPAGPPFDPTLDTHRVHPVMGRMPAHPPPKALPRVKR